MITGLGQSDLDTAEPSDEVLVARVVQGDAAAFTALYERYAPRIYAWAAHALGDSRAEDVVQEVFLRLWNKSAQFDEGRGPFGAWLMAIARHYLLRELERGSQLQRLVAAEAIDAVLAAALSALTVEDQAWRRERDGAVVRALKSLPVEQRHVLVLAYFGGLTQSSIARKLGSPLGTVKKRTRLGLQKLRDSLGKQGIITGQSVEAEQR